MTMDESSLLASRSGEFSSLAAPQTYNSKQVTNPFLTVTALLHSVSIPIYPNPRPLYWLETIGEGLSFTVKKAPEPEAGREVVYKVSRLCFLNFASSDAHADEEAIEARKLRDLMMELYILAQKAIVRHPNIVKLLGVSWAPNPFSDSKLSPVLRMEFAPHGTLTDFQDSSTRLDLMAKLHLCYDIANGLAALHDCGVVHGDVKGDNVLVFDHPEGGYIAKLCDFGCAYITTPKQDEVEEDPRCRLPGGTPAWRAPEASDAIPRSKLHLTDVYSFGLLVWKLLMDGRNPFASFDLPSQPDARYSRIQAFLKIKLPFLAGVIVGSIESACGEEFSKLYVDTLLLLFLSTLAQTPEDRDLPNALNILHNACGKGESRPMLGMEETKIRCLDFNLKIVMDNKLIIQWSPTIQVQCVKELEEVLLATRAIIGANEQPDSRVKTLQFESLWCLFKCSVIGIGCEPDVSAASNYLFEIANLKNFFSYQQMAMLGRILTAFYRTAGVLTMERSFKASEYTQLGSTLLAIPSMKSLSQPPEITKSGLFMQKKSKLLADIHGFDQEIDVLAVCEVQRVKAVVMNQNHGGLAVKDIEMGGGNRMLHAAALFGLLNTVQLLVERCQADINTVNKRGETPLLLACRQGHNEVTLYLLTRGADASLAESFRAEKPLHWLCAFNERTVGEVAAGLIRNGADLNCNTRLCADDHFPFSHSSSLLVQGNALDRAVGRNSLHAVRALLELSSKSYPTTKSLIEYLEDAAILATLLHLSNVLRYILTKIFECGCEAGTYLHQEDVGRAWRDHLDYSLLQWAIPVYYNRDRICAHECLWKEAMKDTLKVLESFGFISSTLSVDKTSLHYAIIMGSGAIVEHLVTETALRNDVDMVDHATGFTAVHEALRGRRKVAFKALIKAGASLDLRGKYQPGDCLRATHANYLHVCASHHLEDTFFARAILDAGVPVNLPDLRGITPLLLAIFRRSFGLARFLLDQGDSVNAPDNQGYTLLGTMLTDSFANNYEDLLQSVEFVMTLADPYEPPTFVVHSERRETVLHLAAGCRNKSMQSAALMALLLSRFKTRDEIETRTVRGGTALQVAIGAGNLPAVKMLLEAGADVDVLGPQGHTTLQLAKDFVPKEDVNDLYMTTGKVRRQVSATFRAMQIVAVIENAKLWPEDEDTRRNFFSLYRDLMPHLELMQSISHEESKQLGMQKIVTDIINKHPNIINPSANFASAISNCRETQLRVNHIIQPWFYMETMLQFVLDSESAGGSHTKDRLVAIRSNSPTWLDAVNDLQLIELQQAARFEFLLHELYQLQQDPDSVVTFESHGNASMFARYALTGKDDDLPINRTLVRYPLPLLVVYTAMVSRGGCLQNVQPDVLELILGFIDILAQRPQALMHVKAAEAEEPAKYVETSTAPDIDDAKFAETGGVELVSCPPASTPEALPQSLPLIEVFRDFHFGQLQEQHLTLKGLNLAVANIAKCSCNRGTVGKMNIDELLERFA